MDDEARIEDDHVSVEAEGITFRPREGSEPVVLGSILEDPLDAAPGLFSKIAASTAFKQVGRRGDVSAGNVTVG